MMRRHAVRRLAAALAFAGAIAGCAHERESVG
jgi:hypothetical protein